MTTEKAEPRDRADRAKEGERAREQREERERGSGEVSPEGVPYSQPFPPGKDKEVREWSEEDQAHEDELEEARRVVAESERGSNRRDDKTK